MFNSYKIVEAESVMRQYYPEDREMCIKFHDMRSKYPDGMQVTFSDGSNQFILNGTKQIFTVYYNGKFLMECMYGSPYDVDQEVFHNVVEMNRSSISKNL